MASRRQRSSDEDLLIPPPRLDRQWSLDNNDTASLVSVSNNNNRTLGAIKGVFAPVSLSMFSTLLFLRVGYIVGNAGVYVALFQLILSYFILALTVCSVSAIATNGAVEGGGVYFMISRTLGPELGGSIGVLFYFANVVGSALYATGCAEGIVNNFGPQGFLAEIVPSGHWWQFLYASLINLFNLMVTLVGANVFGKFSVVILFAVFVCTSEVTISFFTNSFYEQQFNTTMPNCTVNCTYFVSNGTFQGLMNNTKTGISHLFHDNAYPQFYQDCEDHDSTVTFATVFAVLFSGVTGIMAGANLSGELKKPSVAIPYGTFGACLTTFLTYLTLFVLTGLTCNRALLFNDCHYMSELSMVSVFVGIGAILTTFCASTSGLIGASRVLQAVAKDTLLGPLSLIFSQGTTAKGNPVVAVVITALLIQFVFFIGSLNQIAKLCSILFLMSYFSVNTACFALDWASAPNFRPAFDVSWYIALMGMIATGSMIFVIHAIYAALGLALAIAIFMLFHFLPPSEDRKWGSVAQGILFHQVRKYLLFLDSRKDHVKFWRPQILLLVQNPRKSCNIINFANSLKKGGLYVLGHVFVGDIDNMSSDPTLSALNYWLELIDHLKIKAFTELTVSSTVRLGIQHLTRLSGVGAMKPNTVLLGFPSKFYKPNNHLPMSEAETSNSSNRRDFVNNESLDKFFPPIRHVGDNKEEEEEEEGATTNKNNNKALNANEFCSIVKDVLRLDKNLCVHKNFQKLDRFEWFAPPSIFPKFMTEYRRRMRRREDVFFDVWLVDFFSPLEVDVSTRTSCQFMLQLACVVSMSKKWEGIKVRVLIPTHEDRREAETKEKLKTLLGRARIKAKIASVHLNLPSDIPLPKRQDDQRCFDVDSISDVYFQFLNRQIRAESVNTVVSFLHLPNIPTGREERFLNLLDLLTDGGPPCLFVHGVSPVISTCL